MDRRSNNLGILLHIRPRHHCFRRTTADWRHHIQPVRNGLGAYRGVRVGVQVAGQVRPHPRKVERTKVHRRHWPCPVASWEEPQALMVDDQEVRQLQVLRILPQRRCDHTLRRTDSVLQKLR